MRNCKGTNRVPVETVFLANNRDVLQVNDRRKYSVDLEFILTQLEILFSLRMSNKPTRSINTFRVLYFNTHTQQCRFQSHYIKSIFIHEK